MPKTIVFLLSLFAASLLGANFSFATVSTVNVNVLVYSSTNVTTGAYVTLVASTPTSVGKLEVCDTSGKILKLAVGVSGSEVDIASVPVSSCLIVPYYIVGGTRIAIKAVDASATTGYNLLSFIP